ncbi:MAG: hypothetical protein RR424_02900 [Oscillospiraceae bacterium]
MLCPDCSTELRITGNETVVSGDNSPNTSTEVTLLQHLSCQNKACARFGTIVYTSRARLYPQ